MLKSTFITNGVIIIDLNPKRTDDELIELAGLLAEKLNYPFEVEGPYEDGAAPGHLLISVPEGVTGRQLKDSGLGIKLGAINQDTLLEDYVVERQVKHFFTVEETTALGTKMAEIQKEKEQLEAKKASEMKSYNSQLNNLEGELSSTAAMHREGYDIIPMMVRRQLDFRANLVYFVNENGEVVDSEAMTAKDAQLNIFIRPTNNEPYEFEDQDHEPKEQLQLGTGSTDDIPEAVVVETKKKGRRPKAVVNAVASATDIEPEAESTVEETEAAPEETQFDDGLGND